jgi:hypothetical protein
MMYVYSDFVSSTSGPVSRKILPSSSLCIFHATAWFLRSYRLLALILIDQVHRFVPLHEHMRPARKPKVIFEDELAIERTDFLHHVRLFPLLRAVAHTYTGSSEQCDDWSCTWTISFSDAWVRNSLNLVAWHRAIFSSSSGRNRLFRRCFRW